jgi:hypothetical protein
LLSSTALDNIVGFKMPSIPKLFSTISTSNEQGLQELHFPVFWRPEAQAVSEQIIESFAYTVGSTATMEEIIAEAGASGLAGSHGFCLYHFHLLTAQNWTWDKLSH